LTDTPPVDLLHSSLAAWHKTESKPVKTVGQRSFIPSRGDILPPRSIFVPLSGGRERDRRSLNHLPHGAILILLREFRDSIGQRHRPQIAIEAIANRDRARLRFLRPHDKHVGDQIELRFSDLRLQLGVLKIATRPETSRLELRFHLERVLITLF